MVNEKRESGEDEKGLTRVCVCDSGLKKVYEDCMCNEWKR